MDLALHVDPSSNPHNTLEKERECERKREKECVCVCKRKRMRYSVCERERERNLLEKPAGIPHLNFKLLLKTH